MRILFLTRSFNGLAQRLYLDLTALGHEVAVEFDISDAVTLEAVALFCPALVVAPFLKRAIPEVVWRQTPCFIVHPGPPGDRGPSALDWAISHDEQHWGVTVLQAERELDAGPVWASAGFAMRCATKSSLYRTEVTEAASRAVCEAVQRFQTVGQPPAPDAAARPGRWQPLMQQQQRRIDWVADSTQTVLRKLRAADGAPGVLDELFGVPCHLFDGHSEAPRPGPTQPPGRLLARRHGAVLKTTVDGGVWIGHVRRADQADSFKLPTALAYAAEAATLPELPLAIDAPLASGWTDIRYERHGDIGTLHFEFYNGAISTPQCQRLTAAVRHALAQPARVLLLLGGADFWCNGIHLNVIEAAASPADESWLNINALNDLTQALIEATGQIVIAAMQGNAGAGGVFMALAADQVWARRGVVLNPHYKNMGNLHGSEYWTYLLPRRLDSEAESFSGVPEQRDRTWPIEAQSTAIARAMASICNDERARYGVMSGHDRKTLSLSGTPADVMGHRLPLSAEQAAGMGLLDAVFGDGPESFEAQALARAQALLDSHDIDAWLQRKRARRLADEAVRPLASYREAELARMRRNFYGFDPSYHIARFNFVHRVAPSWTPRHLALHRQPVGQRTIDQDQ